MGNCDLILETLEKNAGKDYKSPSKIGDEAKAQKMRDLYGAVERGEEFFEKLVSILAAESNKVCIFHKSVLDGSRAKIRRYYWSELVDEKHVSSPESISVFAEKVSDGSVRFRVSTEINERRASDEALEKHNSLVNFPREKGVKYAVNNGIARDIVFVDDPKEAKKMLAEGSKKVQMCVIIPRDKKIEDKDCVQMLIDAVKKLQKVYEKLA